ncbi:MAG: hypothetical protein WC002_03115 [Candidatus Muiribacteriota bacterium]|jgi:predicted nucleotidyltransferase
MDKKLNYDKYILKIKTLEKQKNEMLEEKRLTVLENTKKTIKENFKNVDFNIFITGSLIECFQFNKYSDIDIAVENFKGIRFELLSKLSNILEREVDLILLEQCDFKNNLKKIKVI